MKLTRVLRSNNINLKELVKKNLRLSDVAPKYLKDINLNKQVVVDKVRDLNNWYTRIIGLDEVKLYQDRVFALQEKLLAAQEKRRNISQQLSEIRKRSNDLQDEIHKVKRQENLQRFLELMKEETEVLKLEEEVNAQFQECDRAEREIFTAFTNAVRDSHEKQRAQVEYTKYFGIILSIIGSLLTFCYSSVKKHDLKRCIEQNIAKLGTVPVAPPATWSEQIQTVLSTLPAAGSSKRTDGADLNAVLAKSTAPLLEEFRKSEAELKEVKRLLLDRSFFLPVIREVERNERELKEIRRILSKATYVAEIPDGGAVLGRFSDVSEDSNTRQYVFIGLVTLSMMLVLKTLFG